MQHWTTGYSRLLDLFRNIWTNHCPKWRAKR